MFIASSGNTLNHVFISQRQAGPKFLTKKEEHLIKNWKHNLMGSTWLLASCLSLFKALDCGGPLLLKFARVVLKLRCLFCILQKVLHRSILQPAISIVQSGKDGTMPVCYASLGSRLKGYGVREGTWNIDGQKFKECQKHLTSIINQKSCRFFFFKKKRKYIVFRLAIWM